MITATTVTAGNVGDGAAAGDLLADEFAEPEPAQRGCAQAPEREPEHGGAQPPGPGPAERGCAQPPARVEAAESLAVYGDSAYGAGTLLAMLEHADAQVMCKVQPPSAPGGRFAKDAFEIELDAGRVTCPAGQVASLRALGDGSQVARFGAACSGCPLADRCTTSTRGRTIDVGRYERELTRARARQAEPDWKADYKATRPKVERKMGT